MNEWKAVLPSCGHRPAFVHNGTGCVPTNVQRCFLLCREEDRDDDEEDRGASPGGNATDWGRSAWRQEEEERLKGFTLPLVIDSRDIFMVCQLFEEREERGRLLGDSFKGRNVITLLLFFFWLLFSSRRYQVSCHENTTDLDSLLLVFWVLPPRNLITCKSSTNVMSKERFSAIICQARVRPTDTTSDDEPLSHTPSAFCTRSLCKLL